MIDQPRRGELWWCELPQVGTRPVVVLTRDAAIPRLGGTLVAPCTTTIRGLPSEVVLDLLENWPQGPFLKEDGTVLIDADGRRVS